MVQCTKCGSELPPASALASISGSILGDECTESFFLCGQCGFYTVVIHWDCFSGLESSSTRGPLSPGEGAAKIELIRQCAEPWNKKCRCRAHCSYFDGALD